ncbi:hypothetical protein PZN02_005280 [Sinorhizobium garamanticum]|uniref:Uncharacterized protein n=1 Tax=Sinorhizobium garamanticum TaxID=680247 RepID=A0ABY8DGB3_9HYPH|nr:hypothetical protein [Sinorhizobium garamanticum]WEX89943.1 hypothetical protein PZN02_005280 [Sinorhizobium garamanticum]
MVRVVDELVPPLTKDEAFVFKVYRSPKDGESVLGYMEPFGVVHSDARAVTWISTPFGVPVLKAFSDVLGLAERHGAKAVWINDPDNLFPNTARPQQ